MTSTYYICPSALGSEYSDGCIGIVITKYTVKRHVDQFTTENWGCVLGLVACWTIVENSILLQKVVSTKHFLKGPCLCIIVQEFALTEEAMGNRVKAEEYFKQAGIADRQKSRTKRKIFESRKAAPKVKVPLKSRMDVTQKTSSGSQSNAPVWRRQVSAATKTGVR